MSVKQTPPPPARNVRPSPPPPPPTPSRSAQSLPAAPAPLPAPAPVPVVVPPPPKIVLEETVRKTVETRKGTLVNQLDTAHKAQVVREEEIRKGREQIDLLTAEIADMDAFLARN